MFKHTPTALRPLAALALLGLLAACSKPPQTAEGSKPDPAPVDLASAQGALAADAASKPAVAASVQAMSAEHLRQAANKALSQNRIYAPAGNNAMEYYLALRDKRPDDAATTSALTDLMPYTVIAAEQSIGRKDFDEAKRLQALIAKADPKAPALPRLGQAIASGEQAASSQLATQEAKAKAAAGAKAKQAQHLAKQATQQQQAAEALSAQQPQTHRDDAARAHEAAKSAPPAAPAVGEVVKPALTGPAPVAQAPAVQELRLMSAPSPKYPPQAYRAGISGEVVIEITVGADGSVTNARVVRAEPTRVFDREALNAVRRWKFEPLGSTMTTRRTIVFKPN